MTELQRLGVVAVIILLVVLVSIVFRRRPPRRSRRIDATGLGPGLYLFTSHGCDSCGRARERLARRGFTYTELSWEEKPETFEGLGIDAVPSLVAVGRGGTGRWWRGGVPRRVEMPGTRGSVG
jgi:hypothetical protein